eukprot:Phypoly_transcript_14876.p2 GENE.Phypoly_transcript_14876~~Phypoly_transcript_14876.p2  ORF type:complete len:129 (-),score=25.25 Phypoly_transcript_14876:113-499(-)
MPTGAMKTLVGHTGEVMTCCIENGQAVSGGEDRSMRVWDIGYGKLVEKLDHGFPVTGVTCDDTKIVSCGEKVVKLWGWGKDVPLRVMSMPSSISCLELDHHKLFAAGHDKLIRIFSPEPEKLSFCKSM